MKRSLTRLLAVLLCILLGVSALLFAACSDGGTQDDRDQYGRAGRLGPR